MTEISDYTEPDEPEPVERETGDRARLKDYHPEDEPEPEDKPDD